MNKAIILAGGAGLRFSSEIPKQFEYFDGKPLICHTISACLLSRSADSILIVCHKNYVRTLSDELKKLEMKRKKDIEIIIGGGSRMESTLIGFDHIGQQSEDTIILLEANRPFVGSAHIDKIYGDFVREKAACAFYFSGVKESLFRFDGGGDMGWLDKSKHGVSQTPYVLNYDSMRDIMRGMQGREYSDDEDILSFIASSKKKIAVESRFNNIKITLPEDMVFAESFARNGNGKQE